MDFPVDEVSHRGIAPAHAVADAELAHQREGGSVGLADEVIEALDRQPVEIGVCRHAPGNRIRLVDGDPVPRLQGVVRSEEHTSELPSLMRISYAVFCLTNNKQT